MLLWRLRKLIIDMGNEQNLGISISEQCNAIKSVLSDICSQEQGIAIVSENVDDKKLIGFQNVIGPKVLITFVGEESLGGEDVAELIGRVRRYFDIMVQRGRVLIGPKDSGLTQTIGPSKSFYDLLERIRNTVRSIEWPSPMVQNPSEYHGMRPAANENWLLDSYIINVSTIVDIGRIQVEAPQLADGPYVQLNDPEGIQFNKSF